MRSRALPAQTLSEFRVKGLAQATSHLREGSERGGMRCGVWCLSVCCVVCVSCVCVVCECMLWCVCRATKRKRKGSSAVGSDSD